MWEFSVGLYMIRIWPGSLLFTAIYGVVESSSVAVFGPTVGTLVDNLTYLQVRKIIRHLDQTTTLCFQNYELLNVSLVYYFLPVFYLGLSTPKAKKRIYKPFNGNISCAISCIGATM
jgi:hypothetical protein